MKRLMTAVAASAGVVSLVVSAFAAEAPAAGAKSSAEGNASPEVRAEKDGEALEEKESAWFEAGFDFDFLSAYVWRNAVQNDEMVMQPCVWADFTRFEPFWFGFSIWQNYDLTDRRGGDFRKGLTETDYNIHVGATAWESDDGEMSLGLEVGHEWYVNQFVYHGSRDACQDTRELYAKVTYDNPFVNVYGQVSWMYEDYAGAGNAVHYEIGFNREYEICDSLSVGADWNVSFGTGRYLNYLYGGTSSGAYLEDGEIVDDYAGSSAGFGGTTVRLYLTWKVTDCFSLGGTIAYTGVLNGSYREALGDQGDDWWDYSDECGGNGSYQRDFVWGGLQAKLSF